MHEIFIRFNKGKTIKANSSECQITEPNHIYNLKTFSLSFSSSSSSNLKCIMPHNRIRQQNHQNAIIKPNNGSYTALYGVTMRKKKNPHIMFVPT